MSKVTTTYDNTLKEKIFIVKGEEGYARTTDCVLEELLTNNGERRADWNTSLTGMKLEFRINVLRDVGASQVVLYDNDTTLGVYEFDTNAGYIDLKYESTTVDNRIELSYGVEHNIYAIYMGNKQCLKSQSKSYQVQEDMPSSFESSLSFINSSGNAMATNYDTGDSVSFKVKISADGYISNNTIHVYNGNTLIDEYTTDSNGETELITVTGLTDGLKTLYARFDGSQYLAQSSTSIDISVGYKVDILSYPSYVINADTSSVSVLVRDYFNEPVSSQSVIMKEYTEGSGWSDISSSASTGSDGKVTINSVSISAKPFRAVMTRNDVGYNSSTISDVNYYTNVTINIGASPTITAPTQTIQLSGVVFNVGAGVKVTVDGVGTATTNSNGRYTINYYGSGAGQKTFTASVHGASSSVTINDYLQYWYAPSTIWNRSYSLSSNASLTDLSNGFRLSGSGSFRYLYIEEGEVIEFTALSEAYIGYNSSYTTKVVSGQVVRIESYVSGSNKAYVLYVNNTSKIIIGIPNDSTSLRFGTSSAYFLFNGLKVGAL